MYDLKVELKGIGTSNDVRREYILDLRHDGLIATHAKDQITGEFLGGINAHNHIIPVVSVQTEGIEDGLRAFLDIVVKDFLELARAEMAKIGMQEGPQEP